MKIELHKYKNYVEQLPQKPYHKSYAHYQKPIRKRKHYHDIKQEESDESDSYITEICRRPRKQRKRIIYDDELDGVRRWITNQNLRVKKNKKIITKLKLNVKGNSNQKTYEK